MNIVQLEFYLNHSHLQHVQNVHVNKCQPKVHLTCRPPHSCMRVWDTRVTLTTL